MGTITLDERDVELLQEADAKQLNRSVSDVAQEIRRERELSDRRLLRKLSQES